MMLSLVAVAAVRPVAHVTGRDSTLVALLFANVTVALVLNPDAGLGNFCDLVIMKTTLYLYDFISY